MIQTVKQFDIDTRTYNFSLQLVEFIKKVPKTIENGVLTKQLLRSGTSIGANIHEAKGGLTKKDFSYFCSVALKSANETVYWLRLIKETNSISGTRVEWLEDEASQLTRILGKISAKCKKG